MTSLVYFFSITLGVSVFLLFHKAIEISVGKQFFLTRFLRKGDTYVVKCIQFFYESIEKVTRVLSVFFIRTIPHFFLGVFEDVIASLEHLGRRVSRRIRGARELSSEQFGDPVLRDDSEYGTVDEENGRS